MQGLEWMLLDFFFFPGKWQQRLIPSVSGTQHSSLRKWHLSHVMNWWLFWTHIPVQADLRDSVSTRHEKAGPHRLVSYYCHFCCCCSDTWAHAPCYRKQNNAGGVETGVPFDCTHTHPQVPKANTSAYSCLGF